MMKYPRLKMIGEMIIIDELNKNKVCWNKTFLWFNTSSAEIINPNILTKIPVIREISRVSKPGRRVYSKAESIPKIQNGLGIAIVSTSKGIMTDNDARIKKIGGEIICKVF